MTKLCKVRTAYPTAAGRRCVVALRALPPLAFVASLALCCLGVAIADPAATALLGYQRQRILAGEYWRLLTAHLTHLDGPHLGLNLGGLALFWVAFGHCLDARRGWLLYAGCALGVSAGLLLDHDLAWYVGLSGVLHGLFAAGAILAVRGGQTGAAGWLLALVAKVAWEQSQGPLTGSLLDAGTVVAVNAHAYGVLAGGLLAGWLPVRA